MSERTPEAPTAAEVDAAWPGEYAGTEEVPMVDWPRLFRDRIASRAQQSDRYRWIALGTVLVGLFSSGITITILGNSLPLIASDIGTTPSTATWILTSQLLTFAVLMPLMGKLGDSHGHRKVYLVGFAVFVAMSVPTALAPNIGWLIVFRVLGAAGGAATSPTSMAIVMHAFPEEDRVKALGWWQLVGAGAPVIGLAAGGPIVDSIGWRWIFVGQGAISILALLAAVAILRETPTRASGKFDVAGSAALAVGVVSLLLGMQLVRQFGVTVVSVTLVLVAPIVLYGFVKIEARAVEPLLPLKFFLARNFSASLIAQFGANFAYMGSFIITPLLVQQRFGYSTSASAAAMALRPLTFSIVAPFAGYIAVKRGDRLMSTAGTACIAVGMLSFVVAAQQHSIAFVFVGLVGAGIGMGTASPSMISAVGNTVATHELGVANAAQSMMGQLGVVVGMGVLSTVQASGDGDISFAWAYACGLVMAVVAIVAAAAIRDAPGFGTNTA